MPIGKLASKFNAAGISSKLMCYLIIIILLISLLLLLFRSMYTAPNTTSASGTVSTTYDMLITNESIKLIEGKKRRRRCLDCDGCKAPKCETCKYCLDPTLKRPCIMKTCKQLQ